ncbi:endonuclease/exonuclease/phosphatase family protein [Gemmatimonadota bacterium]
MPIRTPLRTHWISLPLLAMLGACGGGGPTESDSEDPEFPELVERTFMTYNVRMVGTHEDTLSECPERFGAVMEILALHQPDVIGIQEAFQWGVGDLPLVDSVAQALGMRAGLTLSYAPPGEAVQRELVLLTKFQVTAVDTLDPDLWHSDGFPASSPFLRVSLRDDLGEPWIVYVLHLNTPASNMYLVLREWVRENILASPDTFAVLLGDFNTPVGEMSTYLPGWWNVAYNTRLSQKYHGKSEPIDQICVSGDTSRIPYRSVIDLYRGHEVLFDSASDHHPVEVALRHSKR